MNTKRSLFSAGVGVGIAFMLCAAAGAQSQIQITINGSPVNVSPAPTMQSGRVFVPLRGVFENLGATVVYSNGQINATGNGRDISLHIGSTAATVNGQPDTIDVAPFIVGESTYVPLRFVSQALGAGVNWDESSQTVAITLAGANVQPEEQQPYAADDSLRRVRLRASRFAAAADSVLRPAARAGSELHLDAGLLGMGSRRILLGSRNMGARAAAGILVDAGILGVG